MIFQTLCILWVALLAVPIGAFADDESKPAGLHEYLTRLERFGFAGIIAVMKDGMPTFVEGYGLADREADLPWNPATVSTIGSITKQFTGAAILRLQDQGKLSVHDPITKYFEGVPPDKRTITLHQLLTHSSGIVDLENAGDFDAIARQEFIRRAMEQELAFPPGEQYDYSNDGIHSTAYDMLRWGRALVTGQVLSARSMEQYWAPHVDEGGGTHYAYGWVVDQIGGKRVITHNGGNGIFFADMAIVPEDGLVVFLQTNVRSSLPMVEEMLLPIIGHLVATEPLPRVPDRIELEASELTPLTGIYELTGGGELQVSLGGDALVVIPEDPTAFAYLRSTRSVDLERSHRLSGHIDAIVGAYLQGDFKPLWEAYDRRVTLEFLSQTMAGQMQSLVEQHGPFQRHEALGTALRTEREISLVRFRFENGFADRAYVWSKDREPQLLGVSRRGLGVSMDFYPEGEGQFASWDPRTGESRLMILDEDDEGHLRLRFGEGDLVIQAVKR